MSSVQLWSDPKGTGVHAEWRKGVGYIVCKAGGYQHGVASVSQEVAVARAKRLAEKLWLAESVEIEPADGATILGTTYHHPASFPPTRLRVSAALGASLVERGLAAYPAPAAAEAAGGPSGGSPGAKSRRGGRRPGGGRKPSDDPKDTYALRLTGEQRLKLDALGGPEWVRQQLEAAAWPKA